MWLDYIRLESQKICSINSPMDFANGTRLTSIALPAQLLVIYSARTHHRIRIGHLNLPISPQNRWVSAPHSRCERNNVSIFTIDLCCVSLPVKDNILRLKWGQEPTRTPPPKLPFQRSQTATIMARANANTHTHTHTHSLTHTHPGVIHSTILHSLSTSSAATNCTVWQCPSMQQQQLHNP